MSVYRKNGTELSDAYSKSGVNLSQVYDIYGNELISGSDHRDWSGMNETFTTSLNDSLNYVQNYLNSHQNAFAFPVITDVHTYFGWNEPNYIAWHYPTTFPVFLFLGDMTNTYDSTQLANAVNYMEGATNQVKLVGIGNHEWGNYDTTGSEPYPKTWYTPLLPQSCVVFNDDGMTYYYDDAVNNVRYIMLDSNSTVKKQSGVQRFNMDALNFLATALETSGSKDVIVLNHAMGGGFYLVTDTEKENWVSDTGITNSTSFENIMRAFKNKTTISVTVNGVANAHDYSGTTGNLVGYITGHFHNAGFYDGLGFNKWTCPAVIRNKTAGRGVSFFVVDKDIRKAIFVIARTYSAEFETYEYSY